MTTQEQIEGEIAGVKWMLMAIEDWQRAYSEKTFKPLTGPDKKQVDDALLAIGIHRDRLSADTGRGVLASLAAQAGEQIKHLGDKLR